MNMFILNQLRKIYTFFHDKFARLSFRHTLCLVPGGITEDIADLVNAIGLAIDSQNFFFLVGGFLVGISILHYLRTSPHHNTLDSSNCYLDSPSIDAPSLYLNATSYSHPLDNGAFFNLPYTSFETFWMQPYETSLCYHLLSKTDPLLLPCSDIAWNVLNIPDPDLVLILLPSINTMDPYYLIMQEYLVYQFLYF